MSNTNIGVLKERLEKCRKVNIEDVNINEIEDISNIKINKRKNINDRILDFLNKTTNPYVFKINDRLVKIEFSNNNKTADTCITNVIKSIYR